MSPNAVDKRLEFITSFFCLTPNIINQHNTHYKNNQINVVLHQSSDAPLSN